MEGEHTGYGNNCTAYYCSANNLIDAATQLVEKAIQVGYGSFTFTANTDWEHLTQWYDEIIIQMTGKTLIVNYDAKGGEVSPSSKSVSYTSTYGELPTPTKDGYEFIGWSVATDYGPNGINDYSVSSVDTIARRLTPLSDYSNSTFQVGTYIYFDVSWNTGTLNSIDVNDVYGAFSGVIISGNRCTGGYTITSSNFIGRHSFIDFNFNTSDVVLTVNYFAVCQPNANYVTSSTTVDTYYNHFLVANWVEANYSVTFNPNGGTFSDGFTRTEISSGYSSTATYTLAAGSRVPTITGGALSLSNGTTYLLSFSYYASGTVEFNVDFFPDTLPEIWPVATTTLQTMNWVVTLNSSNASNCAIRFFNNREIPNPYDIYICNIHLYRLTDSTSQKVYSAVYDSLYGELPTPTREGYIFGGWYTSQTGGTLVTENSTVTAIRNHTLYARWYVAIPTANTGLVYNASEQLGVDAGIGYTRSGTYSATNAGTYTATVSLSSPSNSYWADGTTGSKTITWTIDRASISVPSAITGLIYNGTTQTGVREGTGYTITDNTATNAGSYTATATPTSNYRWSDGTTAAKDISWSIAKRDISDCDVTLSQTSYSYDGTEKRPTVTVTIGSVTVPSSNYIVTYANNTNVGQATVTITATENGSLTGNITINFTISSQQVDVPTAVSGLVYNGQTQTGVLAGTGYTVTGNTATNAGTYTATVTLNANYVWSDGTTGSKSVQWSIDKKDLTITAEDKSMVYGASAPTYTYSASGLVNGETSSVLGGTAVYSVTSGSAPITDVTTANVGTYTITVSGLTSNNYEISYLPGELEITTRNIADCNIVLSQTSYTFDGTEKEPGVTVMIGNFTVPTSNYTVEYNNNINVGTRAEVIVTSNGNNLTGSTTVYFEIVTRAYTITYDTNGGDSINASSYTVSATSQTVTLTEPSRTGYTFMGYTITTNTTGGTATITGGTTLNIPANAYGDIEVTATWSVPVTIEIVGQETENTLTISDGTHTLTTGNNAVAEGSNITISTTLTANADASEYQLFSIYKDNELLITTSALGLQNLTYEYTLSDPIETACAIRIEYKEGKRIVVNTDQGVTSEIDISGTSDGDVYATDADNTITITIDTSSIAGSATDNYIGFTYVIDGETHSSYNTGDGIVRPAGNTDNEYTYTITGTDGITSIDVIIRQAQSVVLNTNVAGYNSLSLTSEDGFTRQLDRNTSTYALYVGRWEINVDLAEGANITDVLNAVFGSGNYTEDNGRYYYTITA